MLLIRVSGELLIYFCNHSHMIEIKQAELADIQEDIARYEEKLVGVKNDIEKARSEKLRLE